MTQKQTASQPVRAAALICEYNPFHNGHAAQLAMLRRAYPDAAILCIQSGSFVQRGDAAIFPAPLRAHAALLHGADAVFSLPAAYSLAPAERFAAAGVESAAHLGAEVLAFGAETPQLDRLCTVSEPGQQHTPMPPQAVSPPAPPCPPDRPLRRFLPPGVDPGDLLVLLILLLLLMETDEDDSLTLLATIAAVMLL